MEALVLAGGIPQPDEPLFVESSGRSKALIDVAGKPMVQWVIDALGGSQKIDRIVVIGLDPSSELVCSKPMTYLPDRNSILDNILQGLEHVRQQSPGISHILLSSADIPGTTTEMIDWRIETAQATRADIDYLVVKRETMEERYPESQRSYIRLRDVEVCGGDLNVLSVDLAEKQELWNRLIAARKNARRQAALLGFDLLLQVLTHRISLKDAEAKVSQRMGLKGHVEISPYAELAMDIDKESQLEIIRKDFDAKAARR